LTIPKSVKTIYSSCFNSCNKLTSVTFEENSQLTFIDSYVFVNCVLLPSIVIPNLVTSVGAYAFQNCPFLTSVTLPVNPLFKTIGESAFQDCPLLTSITIPETVTTLGNSCFNGCNLSSITIPKSVTTAGATPFSNNNAVKTIVINSSVCLDVRNLKCSLQPVESITFNAEGAITDSVCKGLPNLSTVILGPAITSIEIDSFRELPKLTSISIPASVISIGQNAFVNCPLLSNVTFENTVEKPSKLTIIDYYAFGGTPIASLTIPKSVTTIGNSSFNNCNKLVTFTFQESSNLNLIDSNAFYGCAFLTSILIPDSVTAIGSDVFRDCVKLSSVKLPVNASFIKIDTRVFYNCSLLTDIVIPETVTTVNDYAFFNCNLSSITIPASVKTFSINNVFAGNNNVKTIVINSSVCLDVRNLKCSLQQVESITFNAEGAIPDSVCKGLPNLSTVILGSAISRIGIDSFRELPKLTSILIPASVTSIGTGAFATCPLLSILTFENTVENPSKLTTIGQSAFPNTPIASLTIPKSVTTIGNSSFNNCNKLVTLTFQDSSNLNLIDSNSFYGCAFLTSILIPDSVTAVGSDAFNSCQRLSSVKLPVNPSFTIISGGVFRGCSLLTDIVIPETVTNISNYAFYNCNLSSITIPASVISRGGQIFSGNNNVKTLVINSSLFLDVRLLECSLQPVESITFNAEGAIPDTVCKGLPNLSTVILGSAISSIGLESFMELPKLTSISIPASVTSIDRYAFVSCPLLSSVTFVPNSKLTTIGYAAFLNTPIASLTIPKSVTTIGNSSFANCNKLATLTFEQPSNLNIIDSNSFYGCALLTSILIPDSVTAVGSDAFNSCLKLSSVKLPVNLSFTTISGGVFRGCPLLTDIVIPETVTTVNDYAFFNCNLSSITIPASVKSFINSNVFTGNNNVKTIVINSSVCLDVSILKCGLQLVESITYNATGAIPGNEWNLSKIPNIISVTFGSEITEIGSSLFNNSKLTNVTFSPNSKLRTIGIQAFRTTRITSFVIPSSVTSILQSAFGDCKLLTNITFGENSQLNTIGYAAFSNSSLTNIKLPKLVTGTGNSAFSYCSNLESVTFESDSICNSIDNYSFSFSPLLTTIIFPNTVTYLETGAFNSCNFSIINIPASILTAGRDVFTNNNNVKEIVINSSVFTDVLKLGCDLHPVQSVMYNAAGVIPDNAFNGRPNLKSVRFGPDITSIGTNSFQNATSLINVSFERNSKLTSIGAGAFRNCPLTSIEIPGEVSRIFNDTFAMSSLKKVFFSDKIPLVIESYNFINPLYNIYLLLDTPRQDTLTSTFKNVIEIPPFLMDFATSIVPPNLDFAAPEITNVLSANGANNKITLNFTQENSSPVPVVNYAYSIDNGTTFIDLKPKQKSSPLTISGLTNGQTYSVSIKAYNGYYSVPTPSVENIFVNYPQPAPVINNQLTFASSENGKASLYFSQPTNNANAISSYWLSINGGEFTQINLSQVLPSQTQGTNYIQLSGLTSGQTYSFILKANNSLTNEPMYSEPGTVNNVFINYPQPAPVINTETTIGENTKVYIHFTQATNNAKSIVSYFYSTNGTNWFDLGPTNKTSPLVISNLTNGQSYSFTIKSYNGLTSEPMYSPVSNIVDGVFVNYPQPAAIIDTQATIDSGKYGEAKLYFSQPTNNGNAISSYWLSINGGVFKDLGQANKTSPIIISNLVNGLTYSFAIKSTNGLQTDPIYSDTATVTGVLINYPQPKPVITSSVGLRGTATINFRQDINTIFKNITNYLVSIDNGVTYNELNPASTSNKIVINNLQNGDTYKVSLKSFNGLTSEASITETIFIDYPQPAPIITSAQGRNNTATIYFDQPTNNSKVITSYLLSINGGEFIDLGSTNKKNPLLVRNLVNGSTYSFAIKAFNGLESDVSNTFSDVLIMVSQPPPTITTTFGENGIGYINFTQQINPSVPIVSNYLYSTDGIQYVDLGPTNKTSPLKINNLTNGATYSFTFKSYNGIDSDPSPPTNDIFINYPQLAPVINTVTTYGENNKAYINFTQPTNNSNSIISYFYSTDGIIWTDLGPTNKTSPLIISNLTNGQSYSFRLKGYNGLTTEPMYSPVSNIVTVFINYPKPAPIINIETTYGENNKAYINFTQPANNSNNIVSYFYSTDGNSWNDLGLTNKTSPLVISELTNGQDYSFTIKAYNGLTSEPFYSLNSNTVTGVFINYPQPAPVINEQLTIDSGENGKAKLYFSQPTNNANAVSSYWLSINGGTFTQILLSRVLSTQIQDTKYIQLSGLTNGQTYSFTLKSFNGLTSEPLYSNTSTVNNVFINYPQLAPIINTTTFGENTKAYINFTQPTNNAKSIVSYSYSIDGTTWIDLGLTNKTSPLVISNLVNGQTYSFTIKAYNGLTTDPMYSVNSNTVTGVFINYPQLAPKILPPLKTVNGAVTIYWSQTLKNNSKDVTQYYYSNGVDKNYYPIDKLINPLTLPAQPANTKLDITIKGFNGLKTEPKLSDASNMFSITQTVVQGALSAPSNKSA